MEKSFNERCYSLLRKVPRGRVTTYKEIARSLGTGAYRAVGNAMNKNPHDIGDVPCHRVVNSGGGLGGYAHAEEVKVELLKGEGVEVKDGKVVDFEEKFFGFKV